MLSGVGMGRVSLSPDDLQTILHCNVFFYITILAGSSSDLENCAAKQIPVSKVDFVLFVLKLIKCV